MRVTSLAILCGLSALCALTPVPTAKAAGAGGKTGKPLQKEMAELRAQVQSLAATVADQSKLIESLRNEPRIQPLVSAPYPGPGGPPGPSATAPAAPAPSRPATPSTGLSALNPEVGVVGDVVGNASSERKDTANTNQFFFREMEVVFGAYVDPYSRADFAMTLDENGDTEIEEAFLTRFHMPLSLKGQVGKFRSKFGKINLVDRNALPMVDEPLVIQAFLGPEGFAHTGVRVQRLIPNPWDAFLEGTLEVVNGGDIDNECRFFCAGKDKPVIDSHLKSYFDLTDDTGLEVGASLMTGATQPDAGKFGHLIGADLTLTHYMPGSKKLVWQSEFMAASRPPSNAITVADLLRAQGPGNVDALLQDAAAAALVDRVDQTGQWTANHGWGLYSLVNYDFHPRWSAGARYDYVQGIDAVLTGNVGWAAAAWLTYHQSELMRVRLQYQHTAYDQPTFLNALRDTQRDDVFLQFRFQIGVDRHGLQ